MEGLRIWRYPIGQTIPILHGKVLPWNNICRGPCLNQKGYPVRKQMASDNPVYAE